MKQWFCDSNGEWDDYAVLELYGEDITIVQG